MKKNLRAVLVLPQTRQVLETQLRKLAPGADGFFILNSAFLLLDIGAVAGNGLPKPCESDAPNGTVRYRELQCTRMVAVRKDLPGEEPFCC